MSSLLEQAIIDAAALREAAVKSAEQSIIEKYAPEVKKAVKSLLEQEMPPADPMMMDPAMGGMPPEGMPMDPMMDPMLGGMPPGAAPDPAALEGVPVAPLAATDGEALCPCPDEGQEITIDFNELAAKIAAEEQGLEAQQAQAAGMGMPPGPPMGGPGMMPPAPPALPPGASPMAPGGMGGPPMPMAESIDNDAVLTLNRENLQEIVDSEVGNDIPDELVDRIAEEIRANFSAPDSSLGGRTTPTASVQEADEIVQAEVAVAESQDEDEDLKEELARLRTELSYHQNQSGEYKKVLHQMQEHVYHVNLSNAKLLYTNRVLSDPSLNERQRKKIVDAISQCGSVEEAKVIYETLQSAVGNAESKGKKPQSLREAVTRDRSILLPRRQEKPTKDVQAYNRMRALAGLK